MDYSDLSDAKRTLVRMLVKDYNLTREEAIQWIDLIREQIDSVSDDNLY